MSNASTQVPADHPLMKAWEAHKTSEEYANSRKWAAHDQHVDGSLWALFAAGWQAALAAPAPINQCAETCERARLCAICARDIAAPAPQADQPYVEWTWYQQALAAPEGQE